MKAETPYIHLISASVLGLLSRSLPELLPGGEDVIKRALALRCLEIPVGDFISEAMRGDLPEDRGCVQLLQSNVLDEEKHDIALNYAAEAHNIPEQFEREAKKIRDTWLELDRHPVLKAVVLERSVFFVLLSHFPIPWRHGTAYDIS